MGLIHVWSGGFHDLTERRKREGREEEASTTVKEATVKDTPTQ